MGRVWEPGLQWGEGRPCGDCVGAGPLGSHLAGEAPGHTESLGHSRVGGPLSLAASLLSLSAQRRGLPWNLDLDSLLPEITAGDQA